MSKTRRLLDSIKRRSALEARMCLAAGAPADGSKLRRLLGRHEPTPLIAAVCVGSLEIVELLLSHGASPNRDTASWATPLATACEQGNREIVERLLERGADINGRGSHHGSPLEKAAWYGQEDLVALLLERGADPQPVLARGAASLVPISDSILIRIIDAGGHAPPEVVDRLAATRHHNSPGDNSDS